MKKQFRKNFLFAVLFLMVFLFGIQTVFAVNEFIFSVNDSTGNFAEAYSSYPNPGGTNYFFTDKSSITLKVTFTGAVADNSVVDKISDYDFWSGTESIDSQGKTWILSSIPPGQYFFRADVDQPPYGDAQDIATLYVDVDPAITSITHTCTPSSRVVLNWTAVPGAAWYEVHRNDSVNPLGWPSAWQITTNSYTDTTINSSTAYIYTVRAAQSSGFYIDDPASASITTGTCGGSGSCGNGNINPGEQCDDGSQNGVQCTAPYGGTCTYCSSSTSPGGGIPGCQDISAQGPFCGDNTIQTANGEACDDGNAVSGDGCSSTCQNEAQCTFTSASWNTTTAVEGNLVSLNVVGTNCSGQSVSFVIWEDDSVSSDDPVIVNPSNAVFSGNTATKTWIAEWQDDAPFGDPEYFFDATLVVNSGPIPFTGFARSGLLSVTQAVSPPLCGNNVINSGETCDDGDTTSGDGCSNLCQIEPGWTCTGQPSVCNPTGGGAGYCGDGFCNSTSNNETSLSCPADCGGSLSCQLTSAAWSTTQATTGQSVNLNVVGLNCAGQSVSFVVWEDDTFPNADDSVTTNPVNVVFSGNNAVGSWISEWQSDVIGSNDPEYYFIANVAGSSLPSGTAANQLLNVNQTSGPAPQCGNIATCGNYADSASCTKDQCTVADNSVPTGVDCNDPNIVCSCAWNTTSSSCYSNVVGPAGSCVYTQQTTDDCADGFLTFSWTAQWTWAPSNPGQNDPEGLALQCVSGSRTNECPAQVALPFFGYCNVVVAIIVIGLVYWVLAMKKFGRRKNRK